MKQSALGIKSSSKERLGYKPSVGKIISLICEQITSETIRKYDEKYLTPYEFNKKYSNPRLIEHYVIPYEKGSHLSITTDAENY